MPRANARSDRLKPRRHRAVADLGEGLTDAEKNAAAHALAGQLVARVLLRDDLFQAALRDLDPKQFAGRYATTVASAGGQTLCLIAERYHSVRESLDLAGEPVGHARAVLSLEARLSGWTTFIDGEISAVARTRLVETEIGAQRLLLRGAGRCCECRVHLHGDRRGELWCSPCERSLAVPEADRRQMQRSMNTALSALRRVLTR